jgi:Lipoprotein LpqB beta-propeller domain/Sporulation and spore germination
VARKYLPSWLDPQLRLRRPAELATALTAIGVVALLAGCATVPATSVPQTVAAGGNQIQEYVQPLPPPGPTSSWSAREVVLGFLHASASYAFDQAAARQFLAPALRKSWNPGPVTIVSSPGKPTTLHYQAELPNPGPQEIVKFTGQRLATLSQAGQYQYSRGSYDYEFYLEQVNGTWLISGLPPGVANSLLLTQSDFEHVYQPRNLFFYATSKLAPAGELVPDPVYAPLQSSNNAINTNVAKFLVRGLLRDQGSWLSGATRTAFPAGTKLLGLAISGKTAVVNLGGAAAKARRAWPEIAEQLQATLGTDAYAPALAQSVRLEINGKDQFTGVPSDLLYTVSPGQMYYLNSQGVVSGGAHTPTLNLAGDDVTAVADPPPALQLHEVAAAVAAGDGCTLLVGPARLHSYRLSDSGGSCTSLSWDSNGNLWAVAGGRIWVRLASGKTAEPVNTPANVPADGRSGPDVLAMEMAPDGVRAALLVKTGASTHLMLAAVSYQDGMASFGPAVDAGPADPTALAWYTPYELLVLTASGIMEVPMTGSAGQLVGSVPAGAVSIAADGSSVAVSAIVGSDQSEIYTSTNLGTSWSPHPIAGSLPAYPG